MTDTKVFSCIENKYHVVLKEEPPTSERPTFLVLRLDTHKDSSSTTIQAARLAALKYAKEIRIEDEAIAKRLLDRYGIPAILLRTEAEEEPSIWILFLPDLNKTIEGKPNESYQNLIDRTRSYGFPVGSTKRHSENSGSKFNRSAVKGITNKLRMEHLRSMIEDSCLSCSSESFAVVPDIDDDSKLSCICYACGHKWSSSKPENIKLVR